jgi:hypothetical protein
MCSTWPFAECTALDQPSEKPRPDRLETPRKNEFVPVRNVARVARVAANSTSGPTVNDIVS